jgi:hypothetical protein
MAKEGYKIFKKYGKASKLGEPLKVYPVFCMEEEQSKTLIGCY